MSRAEAHDDEEDRPLVGQHDNGASSSLASPLPPPSLLLRGAAAVWGSGSTCILLSALGFSIAAALVKAVTRLAPSISLFEVVAVRSALAVAFSVAVGRSRGITPLMGSPPYWLLALRGLFGTTAMLFFYFSLLYLSLADAITLLFLNPAFCAFLALLVLRERFGWRTAAGCLASLAGVVLVSQPPSLLRLLGVDAPSDAATAAAAGSGGRPAPGGAGGRLVGLACGVAGALLASMAYLTIRVIGKRNPSLSIAMWFHTTSLVTGLVPLALGLQPAVLPGARACLCLLGVGCASFSAQLLLSRGFQLEPAARASALNFTQVIWAHVIGLLFFQEAFSLLGVSGAAVIAAGVLAVSLDRRPAAAAPGGSSAAGEAVALKAKGSFTMQPDDDEEEAAEPAGSRAATAAAVQLAPLAPERPLGGGQAAADARSGLSEAPL